ncbi:Hypothetical_protein [Hexamita inflata]|uniref:Hypothetical_protein n=1 Tax=Hexamita inflata TaxID=28002 RepID=A0AA86NSY7_9EUKA|nr:Hypothetical protein HINF_LOCUS13120 [Hexamita inflata]
MQTIIRKNDPYGTDPETGGSAVYQSVETAFVRVPLHQKYWQAYLNTINGYKKLTKHFFVDCDVCYGFCSGSPIYSGLQTVIFLNCKFSSSDGVANHNGANPQIHIETIDDSCKQFTTSEKAAGRSVTELTIKVLCEQLKLIKIPETEKMELINGFIQRRNIQNEEVLAALCASGFDYIDFAKKKGMSDEQILIDLVKSNQDYVGFANKKGLNNDQVLSILVKQVVDISGFIQKNGISMDQAITIMVNQGLTDDQILITQVKSKLDISTFAENKGLSNDQVLIILAKNNIDISDFAQKKGMTNEQVLIALMKNQIDYNIFSFSTVNLELRQTRVIFSQGRPRPFLDHFSLFLSKRGGVKRSHHELLQCKHKQSQHIPQLQFIQLLLKYSTPKSIMLVHLIIVYTIIHVFQVRKCFQYI